MKLQRNQTDRIIELNTKPRETVQETNKTSLPGGDCLANGRANREEPNLIQVDLINHTGTRADRTLQIEFMMDKLLRLMKEPEFGNITLYYIIGI